MNFEEQDNNRDIINGETKDENKNDFINEIKDNSTNKGQEPKKKKNKALSIITKTVAFFVWALIVVILLLLICTAVSKKTDIFGHRMYLIMSGSMEPTISAKDAVITEQKEEYHVGDIIAYEENNVTVVHRIIDEQNEGTSKYYRTKGDANNTEDMDIVLKSQIRGIVKYKWSFVGRAILFIQSHLIFFILAVFILLVIAIVRRLI